MDWFLYSSHKAGVFNPGFITITEMYKLSFLCWLLYLPLGKVRISGEILLG